MTGKTFPIFNRQVARFGFGQEILVALPAQGLAGAEHHFRQGRPMGTVAGSAFAVLGRLMFEARLFQEIIVAGKANLLLRPLQFDGKFRQVAFVALLVFVGGMSGEGRAGRSANDIGARRLNFDERPAILIILDDRRFVGCARRWHAVEKNRQPLLFGPAAAADEDSKSADHEHDSPQIGRAPAMAGSGR